MNNKLQKAFIVTKINFAYIKGVYITVAILFIVGIYNIISSLTGLSDNNYVDMGNYLYMLALLAPIFITASNLKRIIHLGGKKLDFYWGGLLNYVIIAACVSALNLIIYKLADTLLSFRLIILNLVDIFGWYEHGILVAFIQQFAFILLAEVFIATLVNMQVFWYGWVVDVLLITIISVFIPIPILRGLLVGFFNLIIFYPNGLLQIACCFILSIVIYTVNLFVLKQRRV